MIARYLLAEGFFSFSLYVSFSFYAAVAVLRDTCRSTDPLPRPRRPVCLYTTARDTPVVHAVLIVGARRPPSPIRVADQRDISDPERQQQRGQPDPERVRQLRRRVPGRRRPDEDRVVRRRQTPAAVVAHVAAAAAAAPDLVAASHAHAAAVGPALRPAVRAADQVGRRLRRPPEQRLRPAVTAAVVADIFARQPHLAKPHRGLGHITFTRVFAF